MKWYLIIFLILLLPFVTAFDSQTYSSCGGDFQLIIGCIGDSQFGSTFSGFINAVTPSGGGGGAGKPENLSLLNFPSGNETLKKIPIVSTKPFNYLWLIIIIAFLLVFAIYLTYNDVIRKIIISKLRRRKK